MTRPNFHYHKHSDRSPLPSPLVREEPLFPPPPSWDDPDRHPDLPSEAMAADDWENEPGVLEDELMEQFLRYLRTIESEPTSTLARQLISDGIELPDPASFDETSVRPKLWEVIHGLAHRRHFLSSTDHLSDLELYRHLWELSLNQPTHELDSSLGDCACHLDLLGDGSDESIWLWLRYYADETTRRHWAADFPGERVPDSQLRPYDRDRHLPQREFS